MEPKIDNDSSFVKIYVDVDSRSILLTQQDVYEIEQLVLDQIYANGEKEPAPELGGYVFSDIEGALIINSHVASVSWLEKVIQSYKKKALRIRYLKDAPQYSAHVQVRVRQLNNVLKLLEAQNYGLQTSVWKIVSTLSYPGVGGRKAWRMELLIDDAGRETLERKNFKLFLGITPVTFKLFNTVKRCETTGKIVVVR